MKNALTVNFEKKKIIMTSTFAKKCSDTRSEEYAHLQSVRRDYPNFDVVTRQIKKNPNKKTYAGLTYDYMEDYIIAHEPEETMQSVLDELEEMRMIAACHSQAFRYPVIKKWFLNMYPEIMNFGKTTIVPERYTTVIKASASQNNDDTSVVPPEKKSA